MESGVYSTKRGPRLAPERAPVDGAGARRGRKSLGKRLTQASTTPLPRPPPRRPAPSFHD